MLPKLARQNEKFVVVVMIVRSLARICKTRRPLCSKSSQKKTSDGPFGRREVSAVHVQIRGKGLYARV